MARGQGSAKKRAQRARKAHTLQADGAPAAPAADAPMRELSPQRKHTPTPTTSTPTTSTRTTSTRTTSTRTTPQTVTQEEAIQRTQNIMEPVPDILLQMPDMKSFTLQPANAKTFVDSEQLENKVRLGPNLPAATLCDAKNVSRAQSKALHQCNTFIDNACVQNNWYRPAGSDWVHKLDVDALNARFFSDPALLIDRGGQIELPLVEASCYLYEDGGSDGQIHYRFSNNWEAHVPFWIP